MVGVFKLKLYELGHCILFYFELLILSPFVHGPLERISMTIHLYIHVIRNAWITLIDVCF